MDSAGKFINDQLRTQLKSVTIKGRGRVDTFLLGLF